ncbi:MAG: methylated-DNA--[protein]-cysteine S-methyltransferase [Lentisphaerae bacterium]|nr:methylated-DNA--[protein]-cysteine S-methyltransferase [Lentisphaerota bacterium]
MNTNTRLFTTIPSPIGTLTIVANNDAICELSLPGDEFDPDSLGLRDERHPLLRQAYTELHEYFAGKRRLFTLPLAPAGTPFQQAVWTAMRAIPYGETRSYGRLATVLGKPGATRAVGQACNRNPIAIIIPCHRVVAAHGAPGGFRAGLAIKQQLLDLEAANSNRV